MKKALILMLLITALIGTNCKKKSDDSTTPVAPTASALAKVGTVWTSVTGSLSVVQATGGDVIVRCVQQGDTVSVAGSMTTAGFYDYFYSNGDKTKPFPLVTFSDVVGTTHTFSLGTAQVVRTVTSVSTTDDFYVPALGMYLKVFVVKEDVPALTVNGKLTKTKTIYWTLNHKYGVVYARAILTDGTDLEFPLTASNAGAK